MSLPFSFLYSHCYIISVYSSLPDCYIFCFLRARLGKMSSHFYIDVHYGVAHSGRTSIEADFDGAFIFVLCVSFYLGWLSYFIFTLRCCFRGLVFVLPSRYRLKPRRRSGTQDQHNTSQYKYSTEIYRRHNAPFHSISETKQSSHQNPRRHSLYMSESNRDCKLYLLITINFLDEVYLYRSCHCMFSTCSRTHANSSRHSSLDGVAGQSNSQEPL